MTIAGRPAPIDWFWRLMLIALATDLVNNLVLLNAGAPAPAARMGPGAGLALALLSPALGLLLSYFVARRGSNIARWLTIVLVVLGCIGFVVTAVSKGASGTQANFVVAAAAEVIKQAAVSCLLAPAAAAWFARHRIGAN
jgi:hypothetical protein